MQALAAHGLEEIWRRSIAEALAVIELLDERVAPLEHELGQLTKVDPRVVLLDTIPAVAEPLELTIASEIGDVARFSTPEKEGPAPSSCARRQRRKRCDRGMM